MRWSSRCLLLAGIAMLTSGSTAASSPAAAGPAFTWSAQPAKAGASRLAFDLKANPAALPAGFDLFKVDLLVPGVTDFQLRRAANCLDVRLRGCPARSIIGTGTASGKYGALASADFRLKAIKHGSVIGLVAEATRIRGPVTVPLSDLRVFPEKSRLLPVGNSQETMLVSWKLNFGWGVYPYSNFPDGFGFVLTRFHLEFPRVKLGRCPADHRWRAGVDLWVGRLADETSFRHLMSGKRIPCS